MRRIAHGGTAIDPMVVRRLAARQRPDDPLDEMTPRELEVLELMAEGRSNRFIAEQLVVTVPAVERHITSIFAKFGLSSNSADHRRVLAVLRYLSADQAPSFLKLGARGSCASSRQLERG